MQDFLLGHLNFEIAKDGYYIGYVCSKSTSVQY